MTRTISIRPVLNGFVCHVGCQEVTFTDKQTMLNQLSEYYDNPKAVEKRFLERAVNKLQQQIPEPTMRESVEMNTTVHESPMKAPEPRLRR